MADLVTTDSFVGVNGSTVAVDSIEKENSIGDADGGHLVDADEGVDSIVVAVDWTAVGICEIGSIVGEESIAEVFWVDMTAEVDSTEDGLENTDLTEYWFDSLMGKTHPTEETDSSTDVSGLVDHSGTDRIGFGELDFSTTVEGEIETENQKTPSDESFPRLSRHQHQQFL